MDTYKYDEMNLIYDNREFDNYFVLEFHDFKDDKKGWKSLVEFYGQDLLNDKNEFIRNEIDVSDIEFVETKEDMIEFYQDEIRKIMN
jgi:hypothetical protein|tara:strand:+ start:2043 stop:2303 length:261 start_codon:yes stop_codon:yes gene_type:complete